MSIGSNLEQVRSRIRAAAAGAGRDPDSIRLLPVSKTWPVADISLAAQLGIREFGESRPQELAQKAQAVAGQGIALVAIGRLQTNKAGIIAKYASEFQALDSARLAHALDRHSSKLGRRLPVLVQVNTSMEPQKGGVAPAELAAAVREIATLPGLLVRGLMTIAKNDPAPEVVRACFARLSECQTEMRRSFPGLDWSQLSMGMSNDLELAVAEGSTCLRVGQAIFGRRQP